MFQREIVDHARGPPTPSAQQFIEVPTTSAAHDLYRMIRVRSTGRFSNINTLAFALTLGFCRLLILTNAFLVGRLSCYPNKRGVYLKQITAWAVDSIFQIERGVFELQDQGSNDLTREFEIDLPHTICKRSKAALGNPHDFILATLSLFDYGPEYSFKFLTDLAVKLMYTHVPGKHFYKKNPGQSSYMSKVLAIALFLFRELSRANGLTKLEYKKNTSLQRCLRLSSRCVDCRGYSNLRKGNQCCGMTYDPNRYIILARYKHAQELGFDTCVRIYLRGDMCGGGNSDIEENSWAWGMGGWARLHLARTETRLSGKIYSMFANMEDYGGLMPTMLERARTRAGISGMAVLEQDIACADRVEYIRFNDKEGSARRSTRPSAKDLTWADAIG
ncbi:uncharacterized protein BDR25DRAFT_356339 [Lindgomyces ingoldianus]|uniref:Uncharacterized protein n=1 Tax=Lindgomyces ingoldianus TaxID=673940 RepID=A0ACB6QRY7_9PLEO|nr:uncharacterized protein BDR25DRAFT_356339 [Lindgomyces ingoldianus]KAF2469607.1 hypothetical protein BDR25DRAFT_356339 [Lindgomyces ingoldianus]